MNNCKCTTNDNCSICRTEQEEHEYWLERQIDAEQEGLKDEG